MTIVERFAMTSTMANLDDGPRERLKQARDNLKLSTPALAKLTGMSASTIRAHEAGQNQIRRDAAYRYATALGITPDWLMFGEGGSLAPTAELATRIQQVPIIGIVRRGVFTERWPADQQYTPLIIKESPVSLQMECYELDQEIPGYRAGSSVIVAAGEEQNLRPGDDAVFLRRRDDLAEFTIRRVVAQPSGEIHLLNFAWGGRPAEITPLSDLGDDLHFVGEVIITQWYKYATKHVAT